MMPRWAIWLPVAALTLVGAVYAFRLGWIAARLTETDVIVTYAARYLSEAGAGAQATDCTAAPGQRRSVWIVVTCRTDGGRVYRYPVNRFGGLVASAPVSGPQA